MVDELRGKRRGGDALKVQPELLRVSTVVNRHRVKGRAGDRSCLAPALDDCLKAKHTDRSI